MPRRTVVAVATLAALAAAWPVSAQSAGDDARYRTAIERTKAMVGDQRVIDLAAREGLDVLDVTWEDTGRFLDSSVGPNISDMTIQVQTCDEDQQGQETCQLDLMPVHSVPELQRQDRRRAARPLQRPGRQRAGRAAPARLAEGRARRPAQLPARRRLVGRQPHLAARAARHPRPRQRAGGLPARAARWRRGVQPRALQLPVGARRPRRADAARHPRGDERDGHRQRARRLPGGPDLGPAPVLRPGRRAREPHRDPR